MEKMETKSTVLTLQLKEIVADPKFNARGHTDENDPKTISLAHSIKTEGLHHPIIVREVATVFEDGKQPRCEYRLLGGFRRYTAMTKILGWKECACVIKVCSDIDAYIINLTENIQREPLRPLEICERCIVLRNLGVDAKKIAEAIGFSVPYIYSMLNVENLHPQIVEDLHRGNYGETMTQLLTLARLDKQMQLASWHLFLGKKQEEKNGMPDHEKKPREKIAKVIKREKIQKLLEVDLSRAYQLDPEKRVFAEQLLKWVLGLSKQYPVKLPPDEIEAEITQQ